MVVRGPYAVRTGVVVRAAPGFILLQSHLAGRDAARLLGHLQQDYAAAGLVYAECIAACGEQGASGEVAGLD